MTAFWDQVDDLLTSATHVVDRPAGSRHPRYPDWIHPVDDGYPAGTTGGDGEGIDVWFGGSEGGGATGLVCTIDPHKRDSEITYLWRCSQQDVDAIRRFYAEQPMPVLLVERVG